MMKKVSVASGALVVFLGFAFAASDTSATMTELKLASDALPNTLRAHQIDHLSQLLIASSGNTVRVRHYPNSELGDEVTALRSLARGEIEMGSFSVTSIAKHVPELGLLDLPFLFVNARQQDCVIDNHVENAVRDLLLRKGLVFLGWTESGEVNLVGRKSYREPRTLAASKLRTLPHSAVGSVWRDFGAVSVSLPANEWRFAFQTDEIDLAETDTAFYVRSGVSRIAPVVTRTRHLRRTGMLVMNKSVYNGLPKSGRAGMNAIQTDWPAARLREEVRANEHKLLFKHATAGGTIEIVSREKRSLWRKAAMPAWGKVLGVAGKRAKPLWDSIQAGLADCKP